MCKMKWARILTRLIALTRAAKAGLYKLNGREFTVDAAKDNGSMQVAMRGMSMPMRNFRV